MSRRAGTGLARLLLGPRGIPARGVLPMHDTPTNDTPRVIALPRSDFVALLLAALAFCLGYWVAGLAVRLAVRLGLGHAHLGEGSLAQVCLALAAGIAAWRWARIAGPARA